MRRDRKIPQVKLTDSSETLKVFLIKISRVPIFPILIKSVVFMKDVNKHKLKGLQDFIILF